MPDTLTTAAPRRTRIPDDQLELIERLTAARPGLRFDTGFVGIVPMTASGRIGRRYFHFRFRYDHASLRIGSPDVRFVSRDRHRNLRILRRNNVRTSLRASIARDALNGGHGLEKYPSRVVMQSSTGPVTGDPYAGSIPVEQAAALFEQLLASLEPATQKVVRRRHIRRIMRGGSAPMHRQRIVITKHPRKQKNR